MVEGNLFCLNVSFCIELLRVRYHRIVNSTNFTDVVQTLLAPYSDALDSDVITILHSAITSDATRNEKTEKYLKETRINKQFLGRDAVLLTENPDKKAIKRSSMINKMRWCDSRVTDEETLQTIVGDKLDEILESLQESIKQSNSTPDPKLYNAVSELKSLAGDKELRTPREATFQGSHTKTDREQIDILKIFKLLHERFWMIQTESS